MILLSFCFDVLFLNYKLRSICKIKKQIHWRKTGVHPTHTNIVIYTWISFLQSRGEVCTMAPLHLHDGMKDHPLYEQSLLALATLTKVQWIHSQLSTNQSNFFCDLAACLCRPVNQQLSLFSRWFEKTLEQNSLNSSKIVYGCYNRSIYMWVLNYCICTAKYYWLIFFALVDENFKGRLCF